MNQLKKKIYTAGVSAAGRNILDCWDRRISTCDNRDKTLHSKWLGCVLALALGCWAQATQADQSQGFHYHYISLSEVLLPQGFVEFSPSVIGDNGRIYGTAWDASFMSPST